MKQVPEFSDQARGNRDEDIRAAVRVALEQQRKHTLTPTFIGLVLTVLLNIVAVVWGAATLSGTVDNLSRAVVELRQSTTDLQRTTHWLDNRLTALEVQAGLPTTRPRPPEANP